VAACGNADRMVAGKMRRDEDRLLGGGAGENMAACGTGLHGILTEDAVPVRIGDLQRVVQHVADEHRALAAAGYRHHLAARRVAGVRIEVHAVGDLQASGDDLGQTAVEDRPDAVLEEAGVDGMTII